MIKSTPCFSLKDPYKHLYQIGKISSAIQAGSKRKQKTPIQRRLDKLGKILVLIAIVLCALVVVIGIAWKHDVRTTVNIGLR